MNKKKNYGKEKMLSLLRARIENSLSIETLSEDQKTPDQQLTVLLSELQIFQLELEMQNDELNSSHQLLENERAKFAGFFNLAPVGYFILDYLGIVEEANQTGADLLNISRQNILTKRFQSFIASEDWEKFYGFLHKMQSNDGKQSCEIKLFSMHGGEEVYTRMEGTAISNIFTEKIQYYIAVIDITESKVSQQQLIDTNHRLEIILKASKTGTWTMEMGYNKVFLDDFGLSIMDVNAWEFDNTIKNFIELIHPDDQLMVRQNLMSAVNNFSEVDMEFRILTKMKEIRTIAAKGHEVTNEVSHNYFAGILMDISERKKLAKTAYELDKEKQKLVLSATFNAQEKERYAISSALHDSVCQILYGIRMNLQNIQATKNLKDDFKVVNQLLDQAIRETRELSYELTPSVLRDFGFTAGIKEMAQRLSTSAFKIKTSIKKSTDLLNPNVQLYVFRIIQELINNCIKHSKADKAEIMISTESGWVTVIVADDGKGFPADVEKALSNGSGLRGIKNRIFLLNGYMDVNFQQQGTTVTIKFKNEIELSSLSQL